MAKKKTEEDENSPTVKKPLDYMYLPTDFKHWSKKKQIEFERKKLIYLNNFY